MQHKELIMHATGFPQALEIMENLERYKKCSMHRKMMEFEKTSTFMEKSWNFVKYFDETTNSQKTSCQTHKTCVSDS